MTKSIQANQQFSNISMVATEIEVTRHDSKTDSF